MTNKEKTKKQSTKRILSNNLFVLSIAFKTAPLTVIHALLIQMISDVTIFFEHIYLVAYLIDCIQYQKPFADALRAVLIIVGIIIARFTLNGLMKERISPIGKEKINRALREILYEKAKGMDICCYDNPEFYNDFVFAMDNAAERADNVIYGLGGLISDIAMLAVAGGYMLVGSRIALIFVFVSFAASYLLKIAINKSRFDLEKTLNPIRRRRDYISRVFYLPDYVKELRLGRIKEKLYDDFAETEKQMYIALKKRTRKIAVLEFLRGYVCNSFIFDFLLLLYLMFVSIVQKTLGFGALYGLYRSSQSTKGTINGLSDRIAYIREQSLYIEKVRSFLAYEPTIVSRQNLRPEPNLAKTLKLQNVSFTYPGAKEETLSDVSLTINQGEKIAIVGYNGAGKTTLVKLLMRLYDPCKGSISYDGEDIKGYELSLYRNLFATLFQDYQIYAASVAQNVLADDAAPDMERLELALSSGGFSERVAQMPDGIESQLTREFVQGEELSGGEAQKLALCRSLYKNSPVIILDEPSSALDPIAEFELNNTIAKLQRDKTVIFISHRLSTTKTADRIYMFEKGCLIETGTHEELMEQNGKYAAMFLLQAEKYR
ncbi:MAG: ABC transporter ATP-binding protein/permease [Oscillospiraceae bacterium]|nr:ABC transporter ATP-binding protein/permease [Oscillospiraceae bacterium]